MLLELSVDSGMEQSMTPKEASYDDELESNDTSQLLEN